MTFDAFEVIIVPLHFADHNIVKRRPAVVLSTADFNATTGHIIAAMITSTCQSAWQSDVPITDLTAAGLNTACVVRLKLFTLDAGLVVRTAGRLAAPDSAALAAALTDVMPTA